MPVGGAGETLTERALERRVKRWLLGAPFGCYVQVAPGLEPLLMDELASLDVPGAAGEARVERGGVALPLDVEGVMTVNLASRLASRVLLRLGMFAASSPEMLHDQARRLPWEVHIGFAPTYTLRMSARRSKLQAGDEVARAVTGAVARHLGELGLTPRPDPEATLEFFVRLEHDRCTVSLNTTGEHLYRRGLRTQVGDAPVRETLAAAVARLGLEARPSPDVVVDPFCGSGAVLLETADTLVGNLPGRSRTFAFEETGWFRPGRWREVRRRLGADARRDGPHTRLLGVDNDERAMAAARSNLKAAGHSRVLLHEGDSLEFDFDALGARSGLLVSNLPYGVRLGDARAAASVTRRFLSRLGAGATRWSFALLTNDPARVTGHPDVTTTSVLRTASGGLQVAIVAGAVGGR